MHVAIIGAHGTIARALGRQLSAGGDQVTGVIRNPDHWADLQVDGVKPVVLDLEAAETTPAVLAEALGQADAVVFAAGAGPGSTAERKWSVDHGAAVLSIEAAKLAGIDRYVIVSSIGTDDPPSDDEIFSVYLRAKAQADADLRASGLQYTVVRPVSLTNDEPTGRITAARHVDHPSIPRADVAAVIADVLIDPSTIGRTFEVSSGQSPINAEIGKLVNDAATLD